MLLGLHYAIWVVLAVYLAGMLLLGWFSKRRARIHRRLDLGALRDAVTCDRFHS